MFRSGGCRQIWAVSLNEDFLKPACVKEEIPTGRRGRGRVLPSTSIIKYHNKMTICHINKFVHALSVLLWFLCFWWWHEYSHEINHLIYWYMASLKTLDIKSNEVLASQLRASFTRWSAGTDVRRRSKVTRIARRREQSITKIPLPATTRLARFRPATTARRISHEMQFESGAALHAHLQRPQGVPLPRGFAFARMQGRNQRTHFLPE